jgi:hypothetical protein
MSLRMFLLPESSSQKRIDAFFVDDAADILDPTTAIAQIGLGLQEGKVWCRGQDVTHCRHQLDLGNDNAGDLDHEHLSPPLVRTA